MTHCTIRALGPDDAAAGNAAAQALYAHCGFAVVGHWPRAIEVDGRYHDKIRMQLQLR